MRILLVDSLLEWEAEQCGKQEGGTLMREVRRLARVICLAILAVLGSSWGAPRASAEIIDVFTGSWQLQSYDYTPHHQNQRIPYIEGPIDSTRTARFGFDG